MLKVILIHGNGGGRVSDNWLPYVEKQLQQLGIAVIAKDFPDSDLARSSYWIPFLKNTLKADAETVIIGHSSGAICAMRFAEKYPLLGSVLVGGYYTDLGFEKEKLSGYFDSPWDWTSIKNNQKWIVQFASTDDPWIPVNEPRYVHDKLQTEYYEFTDRGHFGGDRDVKEFKECINVLKEKLHII
jgi:uncharacterized protein